MPTALASPHADTQETTLYDSVVEGIIAATGESELRVEGFIAMLQGAFAGFLVFAQGSSIDMALECLDKDGTIYHLNNPDIALFHAIYETVMPDGQLPDASELHDRLNALVLGEHADRYALVHGQVGTTVRYCTTELRLRSRG